MDEVLGSLGVHSKIVEDTEYWWVNTGQRFKGYD